MCDRTPHPSDEQLRSFLLGDSLVDEVEGIERHVVECETCCNRLAELNVEGDAFLTPLKSNVLLPVTGPPDESSIDNQTPEFTSSDRSQNFIGPYRLISVLGEGGMGRVYKARHERLNRLVALKVIHANRLRDPQFALRFSMEAECIAQLQHPSIVQIYDVGEFHGQRYFAMELLGESLEKKVSRNELAFQDAAEIVCQLAEAISSAHQQGVIHRDLKPANVLNTQSHSDAQGEATRYKIVDFGIAKQLDTDSDLTKTGLIAGTPHYMAPEQVSGAANQIGPCTDVYALGVILYELLTGQPPFAGTTSLEVMNQILECEPPSPTKVGETIPQDLSSICLQCIHKQPARRYASAQYLADDLKRFLSGKTVVARRAGWFERSWRWSQRRPSLTALLIVMCLLAFVGFPGATWLWLDATEARRQAERSDASEKWSSYRANMMATGSYMMVNNVSSAKRALESAPEDYRNWEWQYYHQRLEGSRNVLSCGASVWGLAINRRGNRVASCSEDSKLRLWDAESQKVIAELNSHPALQKTAFSFSPDGKSLAAPGSQTAILICDGNTGREITKLQGHDDWVVGCLYSACGTRLLSRDRTSPWCCLWDAETNELVRRIQLESRVSSIAFSTNGELFAVAQRNGSVGIWESESGKELSRWSAHDVNITVVAFAPDDATLATASDVPDCELKIWRVADGELTATGRGHDNAISAVAFSPNGNVVATAAWDQNPRLWSRATGQQIATLAHVGPVHDIRFSPDGKLLVSSSHDKTIRIWSAEDQSLTAVLHGHEDIVGEIRFDETGSVLASASLDGTVSLWNVADNIRGGILRGHDSYVYDAAFSPDGKVVASAAWDGTIRIWDVSTEREIRRLELESPIASGVAFAPADDRLATIDRKHVSIWNWKTGERILQLDAPRVQDVPDTRIDFSSDGRFIAAGILDGELWVWDAKTGDRVAQIKAHDYCRTVAFSGDMKHFVSGGIDGLLHVWETSTHNRITTLRGHHRRINSVVFNHDGTILASTSEDGTARLWNADDFSLRSVLDHGTYVYDVSFSPDGQRLATACDDNSIRIWDINTGDAVGELNGHNAYVHAVDFSPDGTRLVSASGDKTLRIWKASTRTLNR